MFAPRVLEPQNEAAGSPGPCPQACDEPSRDALPFRASGDFSAVPALAPQLATAAKLPLQPKLEIGRSDDPLEAEADGAADRVIAGGGAPKIASLPRGVVRARGDGGGANAGIAPPVIHDVLRSPGKPLDAATRDYFEPRFRRDFSRVRIHTDAQAESSARAVNARAYTVGEHMAFASGHYAPHTHEGRHLLAHELAHTVQQGAVLRRAPPDPSPAAGSMAGKLQVIEEAGPAAATRLDQIMRTGGPVPQNTKVIGAAIIDVKGYTGPKEMRAISGADSDGLGAGASVYHASSPQNRTLSATRSIAGAGPRKEFPFAHVNDAEMKMFEDIIARLPKDAEGTIHFSTVRVRQVAGKAVFEAYPACSGCIRASFEASGMLPKVTFVSHAPVQAAPTIPIPADPAPGKPGPGKPPTGGGAPPAAAAPAPKAPAKAPAGGGKPAAPVKPPAVEPAAPKASVSGTRLSFGGGGWKWVRPAAIGAGVALQVYGAVTLIDDAIARLEKAQTGSVGPEVAAAMAAVDKHFPKGDALWKERFDSWHEDVNYPVARDWLELNGMSALIAKGKMLEQMGDHIETVYSYNGSCDFLEFRYEQLEAEVAPLHDDIDRRVRALRDAAEAALEAAAHFPNDTAQVILFGVYQQFDDVAKDLGRLRSQLSGLLSDYRRLKKKAFDGRKESAILFNFWVPAFEKQRGKPMRIRELPVP